MVQHGMRPQVVSHAFELEGIRAPHQMLSALAEPGVIESLSSKPFTHARTREQIAAHDCMVANLVKFSDKPELEDDLDEHFRVEI